MHTPIHAWPHVRGPSISFCSVFTFPPVLPSKGNYFYPVQPCSKRTKILKLYYPIVLKKVYSLKNTHRLLAPRSGVVKLRASTFPVGLRLLGGSGALNLRGNLAGHPPELSAKPRRRRREGIRPRTFSVVFSRPSQMCWTWTLAQDETNSGISSAGLPPWNNAEWLSMRSI